MLDIKASVSRKIEPSITRLLLLSATTQLFSIGSLYIALLERPYLEVPELLFSFFLLASVVGFEAVRFFQRSKIEAVKGIRRVFDLPLIIALAFFLSRAFITPEIAGFKPAEGFYYLCAALILLGSLLARGAAFYSTPRAATFILLASYGSYSHKFEEMLLLGLVFFFILSALGLLYIAGGKLADRYSLSPRSPAGIARSMLNRLKKRRARRASRMKTRAGLSFVAQVVDEEGRAVHGARVSLFSREQSLQEFNFTDREGMCKFTGLEGGEYLVSVEGEGIEPQQHSRYVSFSTGEMFKVTEKSAAKVDRDIFAGESALIEYTGMERLSRVIGAIVDEHIANSREVFLATEPSRSHQYLDSFAGYGESVKVIEVPLDELKGGRFPSIGEMPAGSLFIFEPLTNLTLRYGTNPAYRLVAALIDSLGSEGIYFVSLVDRREVGNTSWLRELFASVAEISQGELRRVK